MRTIYQRNTIGEHRIIKKFLLVPLILENTNYAYDEERWLEVAYIKQIFTANFGWADYSFVTKKEFDEYLEEEKERDKVLRKQYQKDMGSI